MLTLQTSRLSPPFRLRWCTLEMQYRRVGAIHHLAMVATEQVAPSHRNRIQQAA
jgi:hypothetical protein